MAVIRTVEYICDRCGKSMPEVGWERLGWNEWRTAPVHYTNDLTYHPRDFVLCDLCSQVWNDVIRAVMVKP